MIPHLSQHCPNQSVCRIVAKKQFHSFREAVCQPSGWVSLSNEEVCIGYLWDFILLFGSVFRTVDGTRYELTFRADLLVLKVAAPPRDLPTVIAKWESRFSTDRCSFESLFVSR